MTLDPQEAARSREVADTPEHRNQVRRASVASTVGTTIEWYDYFLYNTAAALVFPQVFFPNQSVFVGTLEAFATQFVGFAARPIGAAIFGHWGDRIGRKTMLIVTLLMMGLSSTVIGIVPGAATFGVAAPILLILMRILQGIAVGGEWSGSVLLSMEWGNQRRRGLFGSWPQLGVSIGLILGTALLALFNGISGGGFLSWGWRVPFLLSLVLVAIGLYIRLRILETPMFAKVVQEERVERAPIAVVIRRFPKEIVLSALVRMSEQAPFYVFTAFVLSFLVLPENGGFSRTFVLVGTLVGAFVELILLPYFGHLSDNVGRKRIYLLGSIIMGVWGFVYFALIGTGIGWVVFIALALGLIPHAMQYGPQASLIAESFPTRLRYGGAGLGYQLASVVAGGPAALIATALVGGFKSGYAVAVYILFCAVVTVIAVILLPDRSKVNLEDDHAYGAGASSPQAGGEGPQPTAAG
ncbi:MAG: MHS family MFS transporter [Streptosporangiales bacterium]|nr:MHS family MFS transporter [Streptosporangiales bacterium]MBO0889543.1 MHS family MFS transporter [Acidothermales bacterium]